MTSSRVCSLLLAAALTLAASTVAHAQLYTATSGGTLTVEPVQSFMQQITLNGANTTYSITSMTFGINWTDISSTQAVFLDFYTNVDTSASSASALGKATYAGGAGFLLSIPTAVGSYAYTLTFGTPVSVPSNTFGVVASLTDNTGSTYSTALNGLFRLGGTGPTVGTNPGFVWADTNLDGVFTGAEQTKFGNATRASIYMAVNATGTAVPEPGTAVWSMAGLGALVFGMRLRSQRRPTAA